MEKGKIEARIKYLQSKLKEQAKKEEKKKLHYQITIARSTILNTMTVEQLQKLAEKIKENPKLTVGINTHLQQLLSE
jgi:hypothetical protein